MSEFVIVPNSPGEQSRWLRHGGGIDSVTRSIGGDELMKTECWDLLLQGQCSCNSIESEKEQSMVGVRSRQQMVHCRQGIACGLHLEVLDSDIWVE